MTRRLLTTLTTDPEGRSSLVRHPRISRDFRARFAGPQHAFSARARQARVIVRA